MKKKSMIWVSLVTLVSAVAAIFLLRDKKDVLNSNPSRRAPQVPISNPGEQSEFITAPSESELG